MTGHTGPVICWFGSPTDASDRAYFHIKRDDRSGVLPDWEGEDFLTIRHIPGSDANDVYDGGAGPEQLTLALEFDDIAAYRALLALRKTTGTLRLLHDFTSLEGTPTHHLGVDYTDFPDVFLRGRPRNVVIPVGRRVTCEATFLRLGGA